jgi:hypothetical protein
MPTRAQAATGETSKIYQASSVYNQAAVYIVALLLPIVALGPIIAVRNDLKYSGTISLSSIGLTLGLVLGAIIALRVARHAKATPYLVLSANGLEYYGQGITIKTSWQNTKEITSGSGFPSLLLDRPAASYLSPLLRRDLYTDRRIPLYLFEYTAHSQLAGELRQHVPHLFVKTI